MQGPAVQDLWMLVSGDHLTMAAQLDRLLDGYAQFCEFDDRQRRLIEPLRTLRMLRHSAWLAERWGDPTFPQNFPHFATQAYWSQQTAQLREQLEPVSYTHLDVYKRQPSSSGMVRMHCGSWPYSLCSARPTSRLNFWSVPPSSRSDLRATESYPCISG